MKTQNIILDIQKLRRKNCLIAFIFCYAIVSHNMYSSDSQNYYNNNHSNSSIFNFNKCSMPIESDFGLNYMKHKDIQIEVPGGFIFEGFFINDGKIDGCLRKKEVESTADKCLQKEVSKYLLDGCFQNKENENSFNEYLQTKDKYDIFFLEEGNKYMNDGSFQELNEGINCSFFHEEVNGGMVEDIFLKKESSEDAVRKEEEEKYREEYKGIFKLNKNVKKNFFDSKNKSDFYILIGECGDKQIFISSYYVRIRDCSNKKQIKDIFYFSSLECVKIEYEGEDTIKKVIYFDPTYKEDIDVSTKCYFHINDNRIEAFTNIGENKNIFVTSSFIYKGEVMKDLIDGKYYNLDGDIYHPLGGENSLLISVYGFIFENLEFNFRFCLFKARISEILSSYKKNTPSAVLSVLKDINIEGNIEIEYYDDKKFFYIEDNCYRFGFQEDLFSFFIETKKNPGQNKGNVYGNPPILFIGVKGKILINNIEEYNNQVSFFDFFTEETPKEKPKDDKNDNRGNSNLKNKESKNVKSENIDPNFVKKNVKSSIFDEKDKLLQKKRKEPDKDNEDNKYRTISIKDKKYLSKSHKIKNEKYSKVIIPGDGRCAIYCMMASNGDLKIKTSFGGNVVEAANVSEEDADDLYQILERIVLKNNENVFSKGEDNYLKNIKKWEDFDNDEKITLMLEKDILIYIAMLSYYSFCKKGNFIHFEALKYIAEYFKKSIYLCVEKKDKNGKNFRFYSFTEENNFAKEENIDFQNFDAAFYKKNVVHLLLLDDGWKSHYSLLVKTPDDTNIPMNENKSNGRTDFVKNSKIKEKSKICGENEIKKNSPQKVKEQNFPSVNMGNIPAFTEGRNNSQEFFNETEKNSYDVPIQDAYKLAYNTIISQLLEGGFVHFDLDAHPEDKQKHKKGIPNAFKNLKDLKKINWDEVADMLERCHIVQIKKISKDKNCKNYEYTCSFPGCTDIFKEIKEGYNHIFFEHVIKKNCKFFMCLICLRRILGKDNLVKHLLKDHMCLKEKSIDDYIFKNRWEIWDSNNQNFVERFLAPFIFVKCLKEYKKLKRTKGTNVK